MVEVVVISAVDFFFLEWDILFYCSGYIILLWCLYYFIVLKAKIDPLLQHVCK